MSRRNNRNEGRFKTVDETARVTGLSRCYIRQEAKAGRIPHIRGGGSNAPYMIDIPQFLAQLQAEAAANGGGVQ